MSMDLRLTTYWFLASTKLSRLHDLWLPYKCLFFRMAVGRTLEEGA